MTAPLLEVTGLSAGYGEAPVLLGVTLTVHEGEIVTLVGSNGAGKTTLLRAISRVIDSSGELRVMGRDITRSTPEEVFALKVAHIPEGRQLFGRMTVEDNLRMGAYRRRDRAGIEASFDEVHRLFPVLEQRRHQLAASLSGGEQQMCAIGRALMAAPRLLLVDEMSLGLAPVILSGLLQVLAEIRKLGMTVLLVEQDVFAAFSVADRAYVMETGRIVRAGPISDLEHDSAIQAAYLGVH